MPPPTKLPPVTPSPRRFLFSSNKQDSTRALEPSVSNFRSQGGNSFSNFAPHDIPIDACPDQFARAPKFSFASKRREVDQAGQGRQADSQAVAQGNASAENRNQTSSADGIKDIHSRDDYDCYNEPEGDEMRLDSVELRERQHSKTTSRTSKRPRLEDLPTVASTTRITSPILNYNGHKTPHRFLHSNTGFKSNEGLASSSSHIGRPSFVRTAPATEIVPLHPLPEIFSPHRRSQKFLPSGMAATMRDYILESSSTHSRTSDHGLASLRIQVVECAGGPAQGMTMIKGIDENGQDELLLLAGKGHRVGIGDIVQLSGLTWNVDLNGANWVVGVEWKVIKAKQL